MKYVPWFSLGIGIPLLLALYKLSPLIPKTEVVFPLQTSLLLAELGILTALLGMFFGVRKQLRGGLDIWDMAGVLGNLALMLLFAYVALELWAKSQLSG